MNPFGLEAKYKELNDILAYGDITKSSKSDLERFAVLLSKPEASIAFGGSQFPQACETVRLMLTVRMSEEQNIQARRESRLALIIACVALIAGVVQAVVAYRQYVSTSPIQVTASSPLPVRTVDPVTVIEEPKLHGQESHAGQDPAKK